MDYRKEKSRSAPVRYGNGANSKKVSSLREINAWVQKGNSDADHRKVTRNTGLLTDNVTKERLLFVKQVELGRERYKFLVQHEYEKKKFIERQKRKHQNLRERLTTSTNIAQALQHKHVVRTLDTENLRCFTAKTLSVKRAERPISLPVTRPVSLPVARPNSSTSTVQVTPPTDVTDKDALLPNNRQKQKKPLLLLRNCYLNTSRSPIQTPTSQRRVTFCPGVDTKQLPKVNLGEIDLQTPTLKGTKHVSPKTDQKDRKMTMEDSPKWQRKSLTPSNSTTLKAWTRKPVKMYGQKFNTSVSDPRYVALKETLIPPLPTVKPKTTVGDIIRKHEILRRESTSMQENAAKLIQEKILAFIIEKELIPS